MQVGKGFIEESSLPGNIETLLRFERRDLLSRAAEDDNLDVILAGHQQDDQYETVLQRLAFGSLLAGLGGIPVYNGLFLRPQLIYSKVDLMSYISQLG
jgi:tRNA(Ile)-lysidine synthase TilS/MesJ